MTAVKRLALAALVLHFARALAGDRVQLKTFDGRVGGELSAAPDAGTLIRWLDGGVTFIPPSEEVPCAVDAGEFVRLLKEDRCRSDRDCVVIQPGVPLDLDACYAVNVNTAHSPHFSAEWNEVRRVCGTATNALECRVPTCAKGVCRVSPKP
jgi:hypothetical protein